MKARGFIVILLISAVSALFTAISCKKQKTNLSYELINSPVQNNIHKTLWLNSNVGFMCGGKKNESGFIYTTNDGGNTWQNVYESNSKCVYDIKFINDSVAYCSGDKLLLLKSINSGNNWNEVIYPFVPEYFNYVPLRKIIGDEKFLVVLGGENFDTGSLLWLIDDQMKWVWHFDTELRTGLNFSHSNYVFCGYGNSFKTIDMAYNFTPINFKNDFITASSTLNSNLGYACGYNGGIYKTLDGGVSWETILKGNKNHKKRLHFNAIHFINDKQGWVVGNDGVLMQTKNGMDWKALMSIGKNNLLSITNDFNNRIIITDDKGNIYHFKY